MHQGPGEDDQKVDRFSTTHDAIRSSSGSKIKAKNWNMFAARLRKGEIGRNTTEGNTVVGGLMVYVGFSC